MSGTKHKPSHFSHGIRDDRETRKTSGSAPLHPHSKVEGQSRRAVTDLLPFCTTGAPLNEAQVVALSDVVGSLKELAMTAVCAASGDPETMGMLIGAVGNQAAVNIVEFFAEEWEVHG